MKTKKRKKSTRQHGRNMGTHGRGARCKARKSGQHGGCGMSGSGKRADHKKTLITKLYGNKYFGKQGITSRGTKRDKEDRINVGQIDANLSKYGQLKGDAYEINLSSYKILGEGIVKNKLKIKAKSASKTAIEKVRKAGGEIRVNERGEKNKEDAIVKEKEVKKIVK